MSKKPFAFGIAGWKNSGKTSLVAGLVTELTARGLKVSTLKHAHHAFDLDQPGTDSFKHRAAGASEVMLVSAKRWAIQHELQDEPEPTFEEVLNRLSLCDLVLVEGYKKEAIPKIEIIAPRDGLAADQLNEQPLLWPRDATVKALAIDTPLSECHLPQFTRNAHSEMADFILSLKADQS